MRTLAASCIVAALLAAGCLSRDVSRDYTALVGKEITVLRDCYVFEGQMTTSVVLSMSVPAWVLQHQDYCEQYYDFNPGPGIKTGRFEMRYAFVPAGTKLMVEAVKANSFIDSGSDVFATGFMIHPATRERVRWMYSFWPKRHPPWETERVHLLTSAPKPPSE